MVFAHGDSGLKSSSPTGELLLETEQQPKRKHRSTIHRVAKQLREQLNGNSMGVYWSAKRLATWAKEDLEAVRDLAECEGIMRGDELIWHDEP